MNLSSRPRLGTTVATVALVLVACATAWARAPTLVATEGDLLPDGTQLNTIQTGISPALNPAGRVVFRALIGDGAINAIVSQNGTVLADGDILPDGAKVELIIGGPSISPSGEVATAAFVRNGGVVREAYLTTAGVLASVGDRLPDGAVLVDVVCSPSLIHSGNIAFLATFARDGTVNEGVATQNGVVLAVGHALPDGAVVKEILSCPFMNARGLVSVLASVSVQGQLRDAAITQLGVSAAEGNELRGGSTIESILGNVLVDSRRRVAFFALIEDGDMLRNVIILGNNAVAMEGHSLKDGVELLTIRSGPSSVNLRGILPFLAMVEENGSIKEAIVTQRGIVTAVGDPASSNGSVTSVVSPGGINPRGQVAFTGASNGVRAVFLAQAP